MQMWHIKITMRGEAAPREQPAIVKSTIPVRNDVIEDLIVDGKVVRGKITDLHKAREGLSGYDVSVQEIE